MDALSYHKLACQFSFNLLLIVPTLTNATPMAGVDAAKKMNQEPIFQEMESEDIPSILQGDVSEDVAAEISMWEFYDNLLDNKEN
jgi:EREBP-like factor